MGLRCPECGSWYSTDKSTFNLGLSVGDICNNQAMTGPHPELCSPSHPCTGKLELDGKDEASESQFT